MEGEEGDGPVGRPLVVIVGPGNERPYWGAAGPVVTITRFSPTPSPSASPHTRSPSLASLRSDLSWSDSSCPEDDLAPPHRTRHVSTSATGLSSGPELTTTSRLCASQELLGPGRARPKTSLRSRLLGVLGGDGGRRRRSASNVDDTRPTPPHDSRVRKFFSKIRSRSQSDLLEPRSRSASCGSLDPAAGSAPPPPASALNALLVGRYHKHRKRRWSVQTEATPPVLVLDLPQESSTDEPMLAPLKPSPHHRLARTRSNSESNILAKGKKRKRGVLGSAPQGSMPSLLAPAPPRRASLHDLTDLAVEDYFSPDGSEDELDGRFNEPHLAPPSRSRHHRFSIDSILNVLRGKSRSVDHTIHNPFDLDVFRKKIGERTSSEPSRDIPSSPPPEPSDGSKENVAPASEKKMGAKTQAGAPPLSTVTYTVSANDTLTSIAARFDTTPSELSKINKLSTRFVYPGQVIAVPDKTVTSDVKKGQRDSLEDTNGQEVPHIRASPPGQESPGAPHPTLPRTPANSVDVEKSLDRECLERFLKISVRHITDGQGVVAGVLLVTPNAVMFDPNVSDPLVIERGPESYGVIAPMEFVVNSALYYDIAHMRVKDTGLPKPEIPKPEIYWGPEQEARVSVETTELSVERVSSQESPGRDASLSKDVTFPELAASHDDNDDSCSCGGDTRETSAFPKAFDHELLTPIGSDVSPASLEGQASPSQSSPCPDPTTQPCLDSEQPSSLLQPSSLPTTTTQQQTIPIGGDLAPIAETTSRPDDPKRPQAAAPLTLAQTQCDSALAPEVAQAGPHSLTSQTQEDPTAVSTNDKKRTTSVTFDLTAEGEELQPDLPSDTSMQETRKQKVLKRLSYPLSWMESFSTEKESLPQHQQHPSQPPQIPPHHPSSAPPVGVSGGGSGGGGGGSQEGAEGGKAGVFSNVFSISNVSSMLSSSPKYLVDFSSGLFARSPSDPASSVRDVSDLGTPPGSLDRASPFYRKQSSLGNDKEEKKGGIPIFHPGRTSMDFTRRPTNQQPLSATSTSQSQASSMQLPPPPTNQKRAQYKEGQKFGLKSMVSMDDMPELFASFDKLIPKPATSCEDPPLYLCLRMGKPAHRVIPKSTPVMSYGKKRMRPEYWFSIPKNRSDELYSFFQLWAQDIYGELNEAEITRRGFVLVEEDTELWTEDDRRRGEAEDGIGGELTEMTKESWEIVPMSEELRRALYSSTSLTSLDLEAFLPEINGTSEIITDAVRKNMYRKLPARAQGYSWKLVFSTSQHGFSLNSLYRKMADVESPIMLFIQDTHQNVFGAVLSCSLRVSEFFYGTGESFLFSFHPEFQNFPWTGENTFFVKGNNESLVVGGGDGNFGLWLDGDLYQGRTQPCKTFNNPQLSDTEDFIIKALECWSFE